MSRRENLRILHNLAHEPKTYEEIGGERDKVAARIKRMPKLVECVGMTDNPVKAYRKKLWSLTAEGRRYVVDNPLPVNLQDVWR